jgi:hypothetical protein
VVLLRARERELRHQEVAAGEQFRDVVACVGEATRGEERGRDRRETMRGCVLQLEVELWRSAPVVNGGGRAEQTGKRRCQRRKKADGSQKDSFVIPKNSRDSSVN